MVYRDASGKVVLVQQSGAEILPSDDMMMQGQQCVILIQQQHVIHNQHSQLQPYVLQYLPRPINHSVL